MASEPGLAITDAPTSNAMVRASARGRRPARCPYERGSICGWDGAWWTPGTCDLRSAASARTARGRSERADERRTTIGSDANVSMVREAGSSSATRIAGNQGCNSRSREIHAAPDSPAATTSAGCFSRADARLDGSGAPCSTETSHPAPSISSASSAETRTSGNRGCSGGSERPRPSAAAPRSSRARRKRSSARRFGLPSDVIGTRLYRDVRNPPEDPLDGSEETTPPTTAPARSIYADIARIAAVLENAAEGDLRSRVRLDPGHPLAPVAAAADRLIATNALLVRELTRVFRRVAAEGRLSDRANASLVPGQYAEALGALNDLLDQLTWHARETEAVARALEQGELRRTMPLESPEGAPLRGQSLRVARSMNALVSRLRAIRSEVIRIAGEVGTAGTLGGQARVSGAAGAWKEQVDAVNLLAANLTSQVRNIALVTTAVARGDLSRKITVPAQGEILELKETVNEMVDQLRAFAAEVTRVAREVGTEGKLGGQADVKGVSGTWKDLTDNVNILAGNLTDQVRNIAKVTTAVANGDLSQKITVDVRGEIVALKNTINTMVDQLRSFASEVTRIAKEVGTEGKLGAQAEVPGVAGVWKDLTDNVNVLAGNLTNQVRNIAVVTTAVARGDLSSKITVPAQGEILELKETINEMVDQLRAFAAEVTRVAREVGTEGTLGGQAQVPGVAGTWKDLTESVNTLAANLTSQVRNIALVTTAVANGELSRKITVAARGEIFELKSTVNGMVDQLRAFTAEVIRVTREVGAEGKLGGQAKVPGVAGSWKDLTDSVNEMIVDLGESTRANAEQDWLNSNLARLSGLLQGQRSLEELGRTVLDDLAPQISAQYGALFVAEGGGALRRVSTYGHPGAGAQDRF